MLAYIYTTFMKNTINSSYTIDFASNSIRIITTTSKQGSYCYYE